MRKLALALAIAPALALAAPQSNPPAQGQPQAPAQQQQGAGARAQRGPADPQAMRKRLRLARTLGLAEALDLDEARALKLRDAIAKNDDRRAPVQQQVRDATRVLRDAARGDAAAAKDVDGALQRLRDARAQLQTIDADLLRDVTQGLTPDKKARAALFLGRFRERTVRMMVRRGPGGGPGLPGGPGGPGMQGPGRGPGGPGMGGSGPRGALMGPAGDGPLAFADQDDVQVTIRREAGDDDGDLAPPELESWFAEEE